MDIETKPELVAAIEAEQAKEAAEAKRKAELLLPWSQDEQNMQVLASIYRCF